MCIPEWSRDVCVRGQKGPTTSQALSPRGEGEEELIMDPDTKKLGPYG